MYSIYSKTPNSIIRRHSNRGSVMNDSEPKLLLLAISPAAPGPLYRQIVDGVKREISEGRLIPGQPLPSFRGLAEDLLVSLITVKRAYEELEREGIIYRKQGLGTFVSEEGADRNRETKRQHAEELFRQGVREACESGMSEKAILDLTKRIIQERKGDAP